MLAHFMEMQLMNIPTHSVLFRHGNVQHACVRLSGTESIRCHRYLILHGQRLMGEVVFAYGWTFRKAGDPVQPISSVFQHTTTPLVYDPGGTGSPNSQEGDGGVENSGKCTGTGTPGDIPRHYQVGHEEEYPQADMFQCTCHYIQHLKWSLRIFQMMKENLSITTRSRTTMKSPFPVMMTSSRPNVWTVIVYMFS